MWDCRSLRVYRQKVVNVVYIVWSQWRTKFFMIQAIFPVFLLQKAWKHRWQVLLSRTPWMLLLEIVKFAVPLSTRFKLSVNLQRSYNMFILSNVTMTVLILDLLSCTMHNCSFIGEFKDEPCFSVLTISVKSMSRLNPVIFYLIGVLVFHVCRFFLVMFPSWSVRNSFADWWFSWFATLLVSLPFSLHRSCHVLALPLIGCVVW